jgi:replication factor C subunit 3/5
VSCLLREIYGPGADKVKLEHRSFKTPSNKPIEIVTVGSNFHIECNPSDAGNNDRFVIQEVIKEIASSGTVNTGSRTFKILVLTEVDRLSKQAQAGLRRTMEKYSSQCRIILVCNAPSKIIEPVRSRCLSIRIPAPSNDEIMKVLSTVAKKENIELPQDTSIRLTFNCDRNIRRALLMLETARVQYGVLGSDVIPPLPDWELFICKLAKDILQEQSPSKLIAARDMLYELLSNCIPGEVIMRTLTRELMKSLDDEVKHEVAHWSAYFEHRMRIGSKEIFHLEAFVAKFMSVYNRWLASMFG